VYSPCTPLERCALTVQSPLRTNHFHTFVPVAKLSVTNLLLFFFFLCPSNMTDLLLDRLERLPSLPVILTQNYFIWLDFENALKKAFSTRMGEPLHYILKGEVPQIEDATEGKLRKRTEREKEKFMDVLPEVTRILINSVDPKLRDVLTTTPEFELTDGDPHELYKLLENLCAANTTVKKAHAHAECIERIYTLRQDEEPLHSYVSKALKLNVQAGVFGSSPSDTAFLRAVCNGLDPVRFPRAATAMRIITDKVREKKDLVTFIESYREAPDRDGETTMLAGSPGILEEDTAMLVRSATAPPKSSSNTCYFCAHFDQRLVTPTPHFEHKCALKKAMVGLLVVGVPQQHQPPPKPKKQASTSTAPN
jgi:translation initiation factor 1 (eIF-1/SUI1)